MSAQATPSAGPTVPATSIEIVGEDASRIVDRRVQMAGTTTRGVLYVHSAPRALCPHIEWAAGGVLGARLSMDWIPQPAAARPCAGSTGSGELERVSLVVISGQMITTRGHTSDGASSHRRPPHQAQ